jgi:predicted XRE-type DNA-binding protein
MQTKDTPPMTPTLAAKALTLVRKLGFKQHQAAAALGIIQGRISEVLTGKRFPGVRPADLDELDLDN